MTKIVIELETKDLVELICSSSMGKTSECTGSDAVVASMESYIKSPKTSLSEAERAVRKIERKLERMIREKEAITGKTYSSSSI